MFNRLWNRIADAISRFFRTIWPDYLAVIDQLQLEMNEAQNRSRCDMSLIE
jgi:hypothetical protein